MKVPVSVRVQFHSSDIAVENFFFYGYSLSLWSAFIQKHDDDAQTINHSSVFLFPIHQFFLLNQLFNGMPEFMLEISSIFS